VLEEWQDSGVIALCGRNVRLWDAVDWSGKHQQVM
jgi:hypothetical protein